MKTPISYYGGKQNLVKKILPLIPRHLQYVEPFVGGGAVFFAKGRSKHEVINDLDGRVTNFYKVIQGEYDSLAKMIKGSSHSEILHKKAAEILKTGKGSDLEKAWAFWVQTNMSFGKRIFAGFRFGKIDAMSKSTANKRDAFTEKYADRLRNIEIFERDAVELIKLKDSKDTFFYCDPPYVSSNCGHYEDYSIENFTELLETLKDLKGTFLLSSYPEEILMKYREQYGWKNKDIKTPLAVNGNRKETKYKIECLTFNYDIELSLF